MILLSTITLIGYYDALHQNQSTMSKFRYSFIILFTLVVAFVGCAGGNSAEIDPTPTPAAINTDLAPVRVGVLAIRSAEAAKNQYGGIINYLSETLGRPFEFVAVGQEPQFDEVAAGNLDFTLNNPLAAVQLRRIHNTEFLVTLSRNNTGPEFGGLIIAKAGSGIETGTDLRGKRVTCVAFQTAAAGCNFQVFHLLQQGVTVDEFAAFTETPSQDNIVLGVLNETFDAGFVRTGQLEKMVREGTLLNSDEIVIVDLADDDFFFPHTTRLYPEWPFAAIEGTDPELVAAVRQALLELPEGHPALANVNATGFVPAIDYTPLDDLIEQLELRGYDSER